MNKFITQAFGKVATASNIAITKDREHDNLTISGTVEGRVIEIRIHLYADIESMLRGSAPSIDVNIYVDGGRAYKGGLHNVEDRKLVYGELRTIQELVRIVEDNSSEEAWDFIAGE